MTGVIIVISVLIVGIVYVVAMGKPKAFFIDFERFLDSYEYHDFEKAGRLTKDYVAWNGEEMHIPTWGHVKFNSWRLNWGSVNPLVLDFQLANVSLPEGVGIFLKKEGNMSEFTPKHPMQLLHRCVKGSQFKFQIVIKLDAKELLPQQPVLISFELKAFSIARRLLLFRSSLEHKIKYEFFVGPEMGNTWVAFDPGTSGSCIAAGTATSKKVIMEKEEGKDKVIPSVITFNKTLQPDYVRDDKGKLNESLFKSGFEAVAEMGLDRNISFHSIKKLLGFTNSQTIQYPNGQSVELDGKLLSALLVNDIYASLKDFLEQRKTSYPDFFGDNPDFHPLRAIVTIPNNFTTIKTLDMLACVRYLSQFKEIRYITEAEAILCYYIFEKQHLNPTAKERLDETILVFDMGGSTINATVADVEQRSRPKGSFVYEIEVDAQIGYGIGGDTIDYCLAKTFFAYEETYPALKAKNPFRKENKSAALVREIQEKMFEVKKTIIERFYSSKLKYTVNKKRISSVTDLVNDAFSDTQSEYYVLLTPGEIEEIIADLTGEQVSINEKSEIFTEFKENWVGRFPLFQNPYFSKYVYDPIKDAVTEICSLSDGSGGYIDTVIFSGRSSLFPKIKETVLDVVKKIRNAIDPTKNINPAIVDTLDALELKTAVVKGACLYGIHKEVIHLHPQKVNSSFGVKHTMSARKGDFSFYELIEIGTSYRDDSEKHFISQEKAIQDSFSFDGNRINFYQVMGRDGYEILKKDQKHKYSRIASIPLAMRSDRIGIKVNSNDQIECYVNQINNKLLKEVKLVADQEIADANDEHYTWIIN